MMCARTYGRCLGITSLRQFRNRCAERMVTPSPAWIHPCCWTSFGVHDVVAQSPRCRSYLETETLAQ